MRDLAAQHVGEVDSVTDLGGLSGAHVLRLDGAGGSVVAKGHVHPRERTFYEGVVLPGVRVPRHLGTVQTGSTWLLLEHLADPLPRSRWGADEAVAAVLRSVHVATPGALAVLPAPFRPAWSDAMDEAARVLLGLSWEAGVALDRARQASAPLFEPVAVISGDANPLNWRLDDRGRPVLLDWERIGLGHPAIDLGILLPGLPTRAEAAAVAAAYGGEVTVDQLFVAKAWSVVEFAAEAGQDEGLREIVARLRADLEPWLAGIFASG